MSARRSYATSCGPSSPRGEGIRWRGGKRMAERRGRSERRMTEVAGKGRSGSDMALRPCWHLQGHNPGSCRGGHNIGGTPRDLFVGISRSRLQGLLFPSVDLDGSCRTAIMSCSNRDCGRSLRSPACSEQIALWETSMPRVMDSIYLPGGPGVTYLTTIVSPHTPGSSPPVTGYAKAWCPCCRR